jgi:hypothetical protein
VDFLAFAGDVAMSFIEIMSRASVRTLLVRTVDGAEQSGPRPQEAASALPPSSTKSAALTYCKTARPQRTSQRN